jgi:hypothetical protein
MKNRKILFLVSLLLLFQLCLYGQEKTSKSLNVTVYNSDLGVIKDVRSMDLKKGISQVKITDVPEKIDPTSVLIKFNGSVIEQNYQYDLVSQQKILEKYIDRDITLTSDKTTIKGKLLSADRIVLREDDGSLIMLPKIDDYQITVGALPEGLITKPTLVWTLESETSGKQDVELTYQTSGMSWHAEYVAMLNPNDTKIDLKSWVSVNNVSGATYKDANLKLVAGEVNRVQPQPPPGYAYDYRKAMASEGAPQQFEEKPFFEYHIYNLQRPTTIADNETKQISLFDANDIKITKKYLYKSGSYNNRGKVAVVVEFENKKDNNLGMPMPAGKVRLYKSDGSTVEFVGEDMIEHTPKDEKVKLRAGDAFDIVIEETEKDYRKIADKVWEQSYDIKIKNHKEENITVEVERYMGYNWEILDSSLKYDKKDAQNIIFHVPVNKNDETVLSFKVRYTGS